MQQQLSYQILYIVCVIETQPDGNDTAALLSCCDLGGIYTEVLIYFQAVNIQPVLTLVFNSPQNGSIQSLRVYQTVTVTTFKSKAVGQARINIEICTM